MLMVAFYTLAKALKTKCKRWEQRGFGLMQWQSQQMPGRTEYEYKNSQSG